MTLGNQPTICQRRDRNVVAVLAGEERAKRASAMVWVAKPPSSVYPVKSGRSQRFHAVLAVPADAASVSEPRNAHAVSGTVCHDVAADQVDPFDDFVTRHDRIFDVGKLGVDDVQVRPANSAGADLHPNLAFAGHRIFALLHLKRTARSR